MNEASDFVCTQLHKHLTTALKQKLTESMSRRCLLMERLNEWGKEGGGHLLEGGVLSEAYDKSV